MQISQSESVKFPRQVKKIDLFNLNNINNHFKIIKRYNTVKYELAVKNHLQEFNNGGK